MENNLFYKNTDNTFWQIILFPLVMLAVFLGWYIAIYGAAVASIFMLLPFIIGFLILVFLNPRIGLVTFVVYSFCMPFFIKHIDGVKFGLGIDTILILTWLGVIFNRGNKYRFRHLNTDLLWLAVVWFIITVLQIFNPERPNIVGWLQEMRSATLYWVLVIPLAILIFNKKSDLSFFLDLIITLSVIGAIYGVKQLLTGPDDGEIRWLETGAKQTHIIFGKLRIFSFYAEAAQFGASQAQLAIMCIILGFGPHKKLRKILYLIIAFLLLYGMIISGTRSALAGIFGGGAVFLILSRQTKIIVIGSLVGLACFSFLKFTAIGEGNVDIRRLRTSVDLNDPSYLVRLQNQSLLRDALTSKPFGTGVGTTGEWGKTYNQHIPTSTIPPDSLFVKVWVMYGVTGLIIWLGIMLYILGKSAGIIWNTRDPVLRNHLSALCAGFGGMLLISYGNEIMNALPSSIIVYISWALIWMSPRWDTPIIQTA